MTDRIMRFPEICNMLGVSRQSIYEMMNRGDFPPSFKLTKKGRAVGWFESDIKSWLDTRTEVCKDDNGGKP